MILSGTISVYTVSCPVRNIFKASSLIEYKLLSILGNVFEVTYIFLVFNALERGLESEKHVKFITPGRFSNASKLCTTMVIQSNIK